MKVSKMVQAEELRYMKIQRLVDLLCNDEKLKSARFLSGDNKFLTSALKINRIKGKK